MNFPSLPEAAPHPADSSARIFAPSSSAPFEADSHPLPVRTLERTGSGYKLPLMQNLQWEPNKKRGGEYAYHLPPGVTRRSPRKHKIYLGYLGKRQLGAWKRELTAAEFEAAIINWLEQKRAQKQIQ